MNYKTQNGPLENVLDYLPLESFHVQTAIKHHQDMQQKHV